MLIAALLWTALVAAPGAPPSSNLIVQPCNFGEAYQFSKIECQIELQNSGSKPIRISNLSGVRPTDSLKFSTLEVPPHGIALLDSTVELLNEEGISSFYFRFETDEVGQTRRSAEVRGFVASVLDQRAPTMDFGVVDFEQTEAVQSMDLSSTSIEDFRIIGILAKPKYLDVAIGENGRSFRAAFKKGGPLGPRQTDYIKFSVNTPLQSEVWVKLKSDVHGDVVAASNPFALGLLRTSDRNEFVIRLNSRSAKDFSVGNVSVDRIKASVKVESCLPKSAGCKALRVLISPEQPTGQLGGVIKVGLPDTKQMLPVLVWGMLLKPDVKVVDIDEEAQKAQKSRRQSNAALTPPVDIKSALKLAVREADEPPLPGIAPLLKWSATNEQLVFGYAIYRALSESGQFVRINRETILIKNSDGSGSKYQWRDNSAVSGTTYWYYVGLINRDGSKQPLSTPQKILAK